MKKISFVIPCYRSAETIGKVVAEIDEAMKKLHQMIEESKERGKDE